MGIGEGEGRSEYTDPRLQDRFDDVNRRFDRLEKDIASLHRELHVFKNLFIAGTFAIIAAVIGSAAIFG
jgi:hypothetical protein